MPLILELLHEISVSTQSFEEFYNLNLLALVDPLIVVQQLVDDLLEVLLLNFRLCLWNELFFLRLFLILFVVDF